MDVEACSALTAKGSYQEKERETIGGKFKKVS
jgi:hypothetical protein